LGNNNKKYSNENVNYLSGLYKSDAILLSAQLHSHQRHAAVQREQTGWRPRATKAGAIQSVKLQWLHYI